MRIVVRPLLLAGALLSLLGCSNKPPSCIDAETIGLAKHVLREQLLPQRYRGIDAPTFDEAVTFETPRPVAYDEGVLKYRCEATLAVDTSAGADSQGKLATLGHTIAGLFTGQREVLPDWQCDTAAQRCRMPVSFTSQNVDGRHVVVVDGISAGEAHLIGIYVSQHDPKLRAGTSAAQR